MASSENIGSFLIGENMIGIARQVHEFKNNPILSKNQKSAKIKSLGGKKAICIINKQVRLSKIPHDILEKNKSKIKLFVDKNFSCENFNIFENINDFLEGEQIVCESENCEKAKQFKKLSHFSASHSATFWNFDGDCCISYVDLEFRQLKDIKLKTIN
nr:hypothetical protein [Nanoarchaeum sp.]